MINFIKQVCRYFKQLNQENSYTPSYRVLNLLQNDDNSYTIHIQIINKSITFYAKPEEILADDKMVNMFSPLDVRTLTYLGYLGINMPKYKILAQRIIDKDKTLFIIKKNGEKNVILKTADEILLDPEIVSQMPADDARIIGYTVATESIQNENELRQELLKIE